MGVQSSVFFQQARQLDLLILQLSLSQSQLVLQRALELGEGSFEFGQAKPVGCLDSVDFRTMGFRQLPQLRCELRLQFLQRSLELFVRPLVGFKLLGQQLDIPLAVGTGRVQLLLQLLVLQLQLV